MVSCFAGTVRRGDEGCSNAYSLSGEDFWVDRMLYVRIELWPAGDKTRTKVLSEITVSNVTRPFSRDTGDYQVKVSKEGGFTAKKKYKGSDLYRVLDPHGGSVEEALKVEAFPRILGMWMLLYRILTCKLERARGDIGEW